MLVDEFQKYADNKKKPPKKSKSKVEFLVSSEIYEGKTNYSILNCAYLNCFISTNGIPKWTAKTITIIKSIELQRTDKKKRDKRLNETNR